MIGVPSPKSPPYKKGQLIMELNFQSPPPNPPKKLLKKKSIQSPIHSPKVKNNQDNTKALQKQFRQAQYAIRSSQKEVYNAIKQHQDKVQKRVYAETNEAPEQYFEEIYQQANQNQFVRQGIHDLVGGLNQNIQNDIISKKQYKVHRRVPPSKDDLYHLEKLDKYRLLKIKNGEIKNKVGELRNQMQQQYYKNKNKKRYQTVDILEQNYYSLDHPKTKQVGNFIKNINQQRKQEKKKYEQYLIMKKQQELQREQEEQLIKIMEKNQRHERLRQNYQRKLMASIQQSKIKKQKQKEFQEWANRYQYEKPLYIRKEQQYKQKILNEQQFKKSEIMKRKAQNVPINVQEIRQHEQRYLQYKQDDDIRKKAQLQMSIEEEQLKQQQLSQRMYKGKYRYIVLEEMLRDKYKIQPTEIMKEKKARQLAYSQDLREKVKQYSNKNKSAKQSRQTKQFVTRVRNSNGNMIVSQLKDIQQSISYRMSDPKQQGKRNLRMVKQMVRDKVNKGAIKRPHIKLLQVVEKNSYLDELKEKRKHRKSQHYGNYSRKRQDDFQGIKKIQDAQQVKAKLEHLQQKNKRNELKQKYQHLPFQETKQLEEGYLSAIKAKLKVLTNFN